MSTWVQPTRLSEIEHAEERGEIDVRTECLDIPERNMKIEGPIDPGIGLPYSIEDLYEGLALTELRFPVGERWNYSNQGFGLLGHVLERATGSSFEALLRKYLFEPLGMDDTTITLRDEDLERLAAYYWEADPERKERPRMEWGEVNAAGGITSSVHDMAKYAAFHTKCIRIVYIGPGGWRSSPY